MQPSSGQPSSGFELFRPDSPLPSEYDFNPRGARAPEAAWKCYGGMTLKQAYRHLLSDPSGHEDKFAHMGPVAFDYYFPVIDRFLRGADPRDHDDHREVRALGYTIAAQLVDTVDQVEPRLKDEILALTDHILTNVRIYAHNRTGQRRVLGAWKRVERRLR